MKLNNSEKLILLMLSDLFEKLNITDSAEIDPKFIKEAIWSGNTWGFEWKYSGAFESSDAPPPEVNEVVNFLDMWSFIELAYENLEENEKTELESKVPFISKKFPGFDGNNEAEYLSATKFMIDYLGKFTHFKSRDLNSHSSSVTGYRRMYEIFEPIRRKLINRSLSVDELANIFNARNT